MDTTEQVLNFETTITQDAKLITSKTKEISPSQSYIGETTHNVAEAIVGHLAHNEKSLKESDTGATDLKSVDSNNTDATSNHSEINIKKTIDDLSSKTKHAVKNSMDMITSKESRESKPEDSTQKIIHENISQPITEGVGKVVHAVKDRAGQIVSDVTSDDLQSDATTPVPSLMQEKDNTKLLPQNKAPDQLKSSHSDGPFNFMHKTADFFSGIGKRISGAGYKMGEEFQKVTGTSSKMKKNDVADPNNIISSSVGEIDIMNGSDTT